MPSSIPLTGNFNFLSDSLLTILTPNCVARPGQPPPGELYWTHHWQKNFTIPELSTKQTVERWEDEDRFPEDNVSDTSSRDYPRLYLESDYGQRTDRENDLDTDLERAEKDRERRNNRYELRDREDSPEPPVESGQQRY